MMVDTRALHGVIGRSPSWGAWIEIQMQPFAGVLSRRRSPSWGAWIEIKIVYHQRFKVLASLPLVGSVD